MIHAAAAVTFDAPLDGAVEVNLLGPLARRRHLERARRRANAEAKAACRAPPPDRRFHGLCEQRAQGRRRRGADHGLQVRLQDRLARRGASRPARACRRGRREPEPGAARRIPPRRRAPNWARPARLCWPRRPNSCAPTGCTTAWWSSAAAVPGRSDGPTPTPSRSPSARTRCLDIRGDLPVTFVRPSIVESAFSEPRPGWIRGFRMAEPVIISYARGLLRQFPGVPEGIVDVIPVDLVVAALDRGGGQGTRPVRADGLPGRLGRPEPPSLRSARRSRRELVHRAPPLRQPRPADRRAEVVVSRARPRPGSAAAGHQGSWRRREARQRPSASRREGRGCGPHRGAPVTGREGPQLRRALRRLQRDRGALSHGPDRALCSRASTPSTRPISTSTRPSSTGATTSRTSICPLSSSTPGSAPRRPRDGRWRREKSAP